VNKCLPEAGVSAAEEVLLLLLRRVSHEALFWCFAAACGVLPADIKSLASCCWWWRCLAGGDSCVHGRASSSEFWLCGGNSGACVWFTGL